MKFLFYFLFTFFISFENNCNNTTPLEVNIDTDQKKQSERIKTSSPPLFPTCHSENTFSKILHIGRRNNHNENKDSYLWNEIKHTFRP